MDEKNKLTSVNSDVKVTDQDFDLCPNCGHGNIEQYCAKCGQDNRDYNKPMREVTKELLDSINLDKRLIHTFIPFFFKPGFLTNEYFKGHRKRYVPPMRMYLFLSFLFFLLLSFDNNDVVVDGKIVSDTDTLVVSSIAAQIQAKQDSIIAVQVKQALLNNSAVDEDDDDEQAGFFETTLKSLKRDKGLKNIKSGEFKSSYIKYISYLMFFLMPFFALLLKLLYVRHKKFYYTQHLIFSINLHSFFFGLASFLMLVNYIFGDKSDVVTGWLWLLPPIYLTVGMHRFYQQRRFKTIIKALLLIFTYSLIVLLSLLLILFITILLLKKG